jgi:hypothetical protein
MFTWQAVDDDVKGVVSIHLAEVLQDKSSSSSSQDTTTLRLSL